jgi:hypothetical protein
VHVSHSPRVPGTHWVGSQPSSQLWALPILSITKYNESTQPQYIYHHPIRQRPQMVCSHEAQYMAPASAAAALPVPETHLILPDYLFPIGARHSFSFQTKGPTTDFGAGLVAKLVPTSSGCSIHSLCLMPVHGEYIGAGPQNSHWSETPIAHHWATKLLPQCCLVMRTL